VTTAPTDENLAALFRDATRAIFRERLRGDRRTQVDGKVLLVEGAELVSLREAMRLAPGPGGHCMCAGDMELTILGPTEPATITVHHGYTLRWPGPWEWPDVALAEPQRFIRWLAERGCDRYLLERAEHAARQREEHTDRQARARIAGKIRARWIAAAPDVLRHHATLAGTGADAPRDERTIADGLAALRSGRGDVEAVLDLLRWFGFDARGRGDDALWKLTGDYLTAVGDRAVTDAIEAGWMTLEPAGLVGIARYFLHTGARRKRMKEIGALPEEILTCLRRYHRTNATEESAEFDLLLRRARQALEQKARSRNQVSADTRLASRPDDLDEELVPRRRVYLRMIDSDEYNVMAEGRIDEVWEVLDRPARSAEQLALGERSWALLREFVEPIDEAARLVRRLWDSADSPIAGSQGYVVRSRILESVTNLLDDIDPANIRAAHQVAATSRERMLTPSARRRRSLTDRDLDDAVDTFSRVRDFLRAAVAAGRGLHVGGEPPFHQAFADGHRSISTIATADRAFTTEMHLMEKLFPRPVLLHRDQIDPTTHLCRPIGGARDADEPDRPWVAIATGRISGGFVVAERGPEARSLIERATEKLAACPAEWSVSATRGVLFWKRPSLLRAYGDKMVPVREMATEGSGIDDFSSDLVLRADVMEQAAEMLRATSLLVGIPKRGWLLVGAGEPGDFGSMLPMHQAIDGIAERGGRDAISRRLFFYRGGTLFGWSTMGAAGGSLTVTVREDADPWGLGSLATAKGDTDSKP
jgi:hypothetical protein